MGALLLDLQGLKGELPRIMPGKGGGADSRPTVTWGGSRFSIRLVHADACTVVPFWTNLQLKAATTAPVQKKTAKLSDTRRRRMQAGDA